MVIAMGHDLCDQRRIERLHNHFGSRFVKRILTPDEQAEYQKRKHKIAYLSGRFAVKEAVYKALCEADQKGLNWQQASTVTLVSGAPVLSLSGKCLHAAKQLLPKAMRLKVFVSISDESPYSSAVVLLSAINDIQG